MEKFCFGHSRELKDQNIKFSTMVFLFHKRFTGHTAYTVNPLNNLILHFTCGPDFINMYSVNLSIWKNDDCVNYFRKNSASLLFTYSALRFS